MQCQLNKWKLWLSTHHHLLTFSFEDLQGCNVNSTNESCDQKCYSLRANPTMVIAISRHFQNFPIWHCISTCYLLSSRILASTLSDNHMHHLAASNACTALHTSIYTHPAFIFSCWWWSTNGDHPKKRFSDGNKLLGNSQNSRKSSGKTWLNNRNLPKSCELFFGVW